jgi:hypothetical protein
MYRKTGKKLIPTRVKITGVGGTPSTGVEAGVGGETSTTEVGVTATRKSGANAKKTRNKKARDPTVGLNYLCRCTDS